MEKLEDSLRGTDHCVVDSYTLEEKLEDKLELLEEELTAVKAQNAELKSHLNSTIKELNSWKRMILWLLRAFRWLKMSYQAVTNRWLPEITRLNNQLEKLEESLRGTDDCVMDIYTLEEKLQDKLESLEEELTAVKAQNAKLRSHLNSTIKELNSIAGFLNDEYGDLIEQTYEIVSPLKES